MSRSSLVALAVLSLGSIVFYAWLLHAFIGLSTTQVTVTSMIAIVALSVLVYRETVRASVHLRGGGTGIPRGGVYYFKIGSYLVLVGVFAWSAVYFIARGDHIAGICAALCAAALAAYGVNARIDHGPGIGFASGGLSLRVVSLAIFGMVEVALLALAAQFFIHGEFSIGTGIVVIMIAPIGVWYLKRSKRR